MTYDITFCIDDCPNTKCERHESHLKNADGRGFYSVAYCKGTEYCPLRGKNKKEKKNEPRKKNESSNDKHTA